MSGRLAGGCLCGAVRFELTANDGDVVDYCHCNQCRRSSGAPVTAWVQVSPDRFDLLAGQAREFASSARGTRWFCERCGSTLYMTDPDARSVGVALGALDDPAALVPTTHGWTSAQVPWLDLCDDLPRHDRDPPYDL
jgi:hypothetical protein